MDVQERTPLIEFWLNGKRNAGAGFRVGGPYVLTASHCVRGSGLELSIAGRVRPASVFADGGAYGVDLAVLEIEDSISPVDPVGCVRADRSDPMDLPVFAVGYPDWKARGPESFSAQISGYIPTQEGMNPKRKRTGAEPLSMKVSGPTVAGNWNGMSGAVVITDRRRPIAVVTNHFGAEGKGSLTLVPIEAIRTLPHEIAKRFASALSVEDYSDLPVAPPPLSTGVDVRVAKQIILTADDEHGHDDSGTHDRDLKEIDEHPGRAPSFVGDALSAGAGDNHLEALRQRMGAVFVTVSELGSGITALDGSFCSPGDLTVIDTRTIEGAAPALPELRTDPHPHLALPGLHGAPDAGVPRMWIIRLPDGADRSAVLRKLNDRFRSRDSAGRGLDVPHPLRVSAALLGEIAGLEAGPGPRRIGRVASLLRDRVELDRESSAEEERKVASEYEWHSAPFSRPGDRDDTMTLMLRRYAMERDFRSGGFTDDSLRLTPEGIGQLVRDVWTRLAQVRETELANDLEEQGLREAFDGPHPR
ncbi:serine protease [Microbacterium sp. BWT-B31]|uniref:S1 family peptidase n=1 Tax=Microbacterium sp. BWT-B31 TaxID=3232072 RepID=UPI00352940B2